MWKKVLSLCVWLLAPLGAQAEDIIVSFTFDDAPKSVVTVGLPLMAEAGYPATVYITTLNTSVPDYMSWEDVAVVAAQGWEIGAHTHLHLDLTTLTDEAITLDLETANDDFLRHGFDPVAFATPFGAYDDRVLEIVKRYYESHRAAWPAGTNSFSPDPYAIVSYKITRDTTIEEVTSLLENLQKTGGWVVFQLHHLFPQGEVVTEEYGSDLLSEIIEQVQSRNIAVLTVSDALKQLKE